MKRSIRTRPFRAAVVCWFALSIYATAFPLQTKAPPHQKPDWEDKIIPGSQLTVLELTRRIIPDMKSDPNKADRMIANDLSGIRLLDGVEETGMELDTDAVDEHEIAETDYLWMTDDADKLLVLLFEVDGKVVIGLFKVLPAVSLLDAVTIAQDMHVNVDSEKLWQIRSGGQAFTVQCWHDNSSESFDAYTFISIVNHKLRAIAEPGAFSGFADYSAARQRLCKTSTTPKFQFVPSVGRGFFDLIVTEMTLKVCHRESEEWSWKTGIVHRKSVRRLWRWSGRVRQYRKASTPKNSLSTHQVSIGHRFQLAKII